MAKDMKCREYRENIIPFVKNQLSDIENMKLIRHAEHCKSCKEEMKIQYFVWEGLNRLETGGNFDLETDFARQLVETRRKSRALIWFRRIGYILDGILVLSGILLLIVGMIHK